MDNFKMKGSSFFGKNCKCNSDANKSPLKKKGGYHKGQVSDAKREEMNDNIFLGKGPAKPKGMMDARPKTFPKRNPDSSTDISAVPTFSDFINEAKNNRKDPDYKRAKKINKNNRPEPTFEGTDEFRSKKNISKSERKKRGV